MGGRKYASEGDFCAVIGSCEGAKEVKEEYVVRGVEIAGERVVDNEEVGVNGGVCSDVLGDVDSWRYGAL